MNRLAYVFAIVFAQVVISRAGLLPCLTGKLLEIKSCTGDFKMGYKNITINKVAENTYNASGYVYIKKEVTGPLAIDINIYKCTTQYANETCQMYAQLNTMGCGEIEEKRGAVYEMIKYADNEIKKCPLLPQTIRVENYQIKISDSDATAASIAGKTWFVTIKGRSSSVSDELDLCTNIWLEIEDCAGPKRKYTNFGG